MCFKEIGTIKIVHIGTVMCQYDLVDLSDNSFVISKFEYFFTVFVYDFSVLSGDLVFVNNCDFPDLFFTILLKLTNC